MLNLEGLSRQMADYATDEHGYEDIRLFFLGILKSVYYQGTDFGFNKHSDILNVYKKKQKDKWLEEYKLQREDIQEIIITKIEDNQETS